MNYRFLPLIVMACGFFAGTTLTAQNNAIALPDTLPALDSLPDWDLSVLAVNISNVARQLEPDFAQAASSATAERETAEQAWKTAKQDTLTPKTTLDSLAAILKNAKSAEKTAQKNHKQATQTLAFAEKVANMDAANQRKNLRKAHKQVQELDAMLHPPAEKPIADMLGTTGVGDSVVVTTDSASVAQRKGKEKKPGKPGPKYKPYDPADDVLRNPPQRPCALAVSTRDEFSGETYRETQRVELFRYTNAVMKKILPPDQPHILCEGALSSGGSLVSLHLHFRIQDANARRTFGSLGRNSVAILKFIDGTTFTLVNLRNDEGTFDPSGQSVSYRAQYALDASIVKKIRKNELDKIRVAWGTGYEDYEVQGVDALMWVGRCLFE